MADATDTRSTPGAQCESARQHSADTPERTAAWDWPMPPFAHGEVDHLVQGICERHSSGEGGAAALGMAQGLADAACSTLDGIAAKLEWVLEHRIANIEVAELPTAGSWDLVELIAVTTSVLGLHRLIRCHREG